MKVLWQIAEGQFTEQNIIEKTEPNVNLTS